MNGDFSISIILVQNVESNMDPKYGQSFLQIKMALYRNNVVSGCYLNIIAVYDKVFIKYGLFIHTGLKNTIPRHYITLFQSLK